ncbi:MAG: HU family DNA-binding protein [Balneola sp.]|nr:HU family DNA-binding protein [Balneola sp.]MBO6651456.1 HU family DNA-binding protein [Balneola sp.]MBO6712507.1 HU family DNA-binding protein [Balneola sp.]MBO6801000.1 HU family DNA-binding protein [Balneola sp.]MBO6870672.1 HU family DNA-binding protein [Balneola sp.]
MNKSETIKALSERLELTQTRTEELYNSLVSTFTEHLSENNGFSIPDFGSFSSEIREEYKSYNPHYKQMMLLPKKKVVRFSQSSALKDEFNEVEL